MEAAAVIPAYNEGRTIGAILAVLQKCPRLNQIIVVSDGSTDQTVKVARSFRGVELIELSENIGKGGAIMAGVERTRAEVLLFLDADLIGFRENHVYSLLAPVVGGRAQMAIGVFDRGRIATDVAQKMAPFLSGQRALRRDLLVGLDCLDISRFGMEMMLHRYAEENKIVTTTIRLPDLSHVLKEKKRGIWKGSLARLQMYWEILKYATKAGYYFR